METPARVTRVLARGADGSAVKELATGMIEITFDGEAIRMSSTRYWIFMELMSKAACAFAHDAALV